MSKAKPTKKSTKKRTSKASSKASNGAEGPPLADRALRAALDLAAVKPWRDVTMQEIAKAAGCSDVELSRLFKNQADIQKAYADMVDARVAESVQLDPESTERDRLFDVMMERFDVMSDDRDALFSILDTLYCDLPQTFMFFPHVKVSMDRMLGLAGIDTQGPCGTLKSVGLFGVYLYTLRSWKNDKSIDLSKTMAALDRALEQAEQMAAFLKL